MPLEVADFIKALVQTNPPGTDPKSSADDHLRLIKHVLQTQFSGFTDGVAITRKETDINQGFNLNPPVVDLNDVSYRGTVNKRWVGGAFTNGPPGETAGTTNVQVIWTPCAADGSYGMQQFISSNRAQRWRRFWRASAYTTWVKEPYVQTSMAGPGFLLIEDFQLCWGQTGNIAGGSSASYTFARQFASNPLGAVATAFWTQPVGTFGTLAINGLNQNQITLFAQGSSTGVQVSGTYLAFGIGSPP